MKTFNLAFPGLLVVSWLALATGALAQHQGHHQNPQHSPYSGFETRSIKALSEAQIADLKAGRGMGLALAAGSQRLSWSDACAGTGGQTWTDA